MNSALPSDQIQCVDALRQRLLELEKQLAEAQKKLSGKDPLIDKLESIIADLAQRHWGRSSEKHPGQGELSLFNEAELLALQEAINESEDDDQPKPDSTADDDQSTPDSEPKAEPRPRKPRRPRVLPDTLERVVITHTLDSELGTCPQGGRWVVIGEEITEQLGIIPARQFVIQHVKQKYACSCKSCGVKTAPMPEQPLPGSQASPSLLAYTMVSKFSDALPLYRQQKMWERQGLDLSRAKLARWSIEACGQLKPLYNLMQEAFFAYDIAQSDDTGIQVLKEDGRAPSTQSALWIRRGGSPETPVVLLDYHTSKGSAVASELLSEFKGALVVDAAACFESIVSANGLKRVLCNDHCRRRFVKAAKNAPKSDKNSTVPVTWVATKAIAFYKQLYRIEQKIKDWKPDKKQAHRQRVAVPIWDQFMQWAKQVHTAGVRHYKTRDALNYLIKYEQDLRSYCSDGRLPISNIRSEHVAKTIAVARKNFLFADTPAGAEASALIYSVIESAKANGHNPMSYLSVVLEKMPQARCVADIEALLPWNLTPEQAERLYRCQPNPDFQKNKPCTG